VHKEFSTEALVEIDDCVADGFDLEVIAEIFTYQGVLVTIRRRIDWNARSV
jgi:hypothetical protein